MPDISELLDAHLKGPIQALTLATVAHSLPAAYAFKKTGVKELWQDATFRAVQANLAAKFGLRKTDVSEQTSMVNRLMKESDWTTDYYQTKAAWLCAANRAQLFLALESGETMGRQDVTGPKRDMVHALVSYHRQILSGGDNYRKQDGGVYMDDLDMTRLSLWLRVDYGRDVGYRSYDLRFPYNPAEKPLRLFDVGDAAVSLGLGYWTMQAGVSGKHGRFRIYLPGWLDGLSFPQLPELGTMPDWPTGQVIHYQNNQLGPSAYEEGEI